MRLHPDDRLARAALLRSRSTEETELELGEMAAALLTAGTGGMLCCLGVMAGIFLPVVSHYGYSTMFLIFAGCTAAYFLVTVFLLPETKGKTLEEIEQCFEERPA
jgi:Sugar (and other) transporter